MTVSVEIPEPPRSDEAEMAVIGAILEDNSAFDRVGDLVVAEDFTRPQTRAAWEAISAMVTACKPVDVITLAEVTGQSSRDLFAWQTSSPSAAHARRYAEIVRERSIERKLQRIGIDLAKSAGSADRDATAKLDAAMAALTAAASTATTTESQGIDTALLAWLDRLQAEASGQSRVIQTGLRALDRQLAGGLREGELMVIGARPKQGKTALVLTLARAMSQRYGVLICSQEMPVHELVSRHVAALGRVNLADLRRPELLDQNDGWSRVTDAIERMKAMAMVMDEQRALTLADVRRKVMEAKRRHAVDVVIIDFLQLMAGEGDNRNQELDRISNGLKAMAGEFKCAVILLSQLSREADKRAGPPVMTDLRDSGAIEAAADIIALLYREFAHPLGDHSEQWRHYAQLEIVQRNGAPGTISLSFSGEHQYFADWEGAPPARIGRASTRRVASVGMD